MPVINSTSANLKKYKEQTIRKVKNLVVDSITEVEIKATRQAPTFVSIDKSFSNSGLTGEVGVMGENPIAAYIEFGTGLHAAQLLTSYPAWIRDIAMAFYVNGRGTLKAKPYLFNNFMVVEEKFISKLNSILNEPFDDN